MKKFNINEYLYIQITKDGWGHLGETVGADYIESCIKSHSEEVNGEIWYRLQAHSVFELLPVNSIRTGKLLFYTNVLIDDESLKDVKR